MDIAYSIAIILHVLPGVFWAGTTFVLARNGARGAEMLFFPQIGSGIVTILVGAYLMFTMFGGGGAPLTLSLGAGAAVIAFIVQAAIVGPVRGRIASDPAARSRAAAGERISAVLLALAVIGMVVR
jgi:hypothetical protein